MGKHTTADIRNIALIGGPATGKTTLAEAILFKTGAIQRQGSVGDGTTVADWEEDEQEKQHSLRLSVMKAEYKGCRINLLDTPGYPDFVGEAACGLGAAELAALCVSMTHGLTFPGRKSWELAGRAKRARCIVLTHIDQAEFDLAATCEQLGESLGVRCVPVTIPSGTGTGLTGVNAVPLGGKAEGEMAGLRDALIEAVVEIDEAVMTRYLEENQPPSEDEAHGLLCRSLVAGELVPVLCVDSLSGLGVPELLEFVKRSCPSPEHGPFRTTLDGDEVSPQAEGTTAFVFKTLIDPFVGKLCLMRVVCGHLEPGASVTLARTGKHEKLAHLQEMQGKAHTEVHGAVAGDIVAVAKVDEIETSDTLNVGVNDRMLEPLVVPKPMAARAVEPANRADELKLSTALRRVASEDPAFSYERSESTGELVAHGTSIMHIETVLHRIKERSGVDVKLSVPRVPLKETITSKSDGHFRHKKQTGGRGQFAEVFLSVEPGERGTGLEFIDDTVGGSIPRNFLPAVEKGVVEEMNKGIIAGYPVVDVVVRVKDGKYHDVDSDEASFKRAGARAFREGFSKARPVLLEPLLDMEVAVPSRFMGAITSDMTGRRGHISGMESMGGVQVVRTRVPQREVLTYPTVLHSLTAGEGTFSAEFHDYEIVPSNVQQEIMAQYKPAEED